jgi:hypothetical protein
VAETRRLLRESLRRWGVPALTDTAELLTTELVTNALRHTTGAAVLTATLTAGAAAGTSGPGTGTGTGAATAVGSGAWQERRNPPAPGPAAGRLVRRLRVEVHDSLARPPSADTARRAAAAAQAGEHGTSGRGLLLVQALADAWGAQSRGTGKVVWFELNAGAA